MSFLFSDANVLYSAALGLVILLFVVEAMGVFFGVSLMAALDDISPIDVDSDLSATTPGEVISWLCLDRLPLMIWLIIWLTGFCITGFILTSFVAAWLPFPLPLLVHLSASMILATLATARIGAVVARLIPKQQSSAITTDALTGFTAQITLGTATPGSPAEAKVQDSFQQVHYVMVEPIESDQFNQGDTVILVQKGPRGWLAMRYQ